MEVLGSADSAGVGMVAVADVIEIKLTTQPYRSTVMISLDDGKMTNS